MRPDEHLQSKTPPPATEIVAALGWVLSIFRSSARGLADACRSGGLSATLGEQARYVWGHGASPSEQRSWERSLPILADDLISAGLAEVEVLVEHQLPLSSRRIDAIICGTHPVTGIPSYVLVELKQWSSVTVDPGSPSLCYVEGYGDRPVLHPVQQASDYANYSARFRAGAATAA